MVCVYPYVWGCMGLFTYSKEAEYTESLTESVKHTVMSQRTECAFSASAY